MNLTQKMNYGTVPFYLKQDF